MSRKKIKASGQLPLKIDEGRSRDRNFDQGGRSFYFFDIDDNIFHLDTKIVLFHKKTKEELELSTQDFALVQSFLGDPGHVYENYQIKDLEGVDGSFRNFRDRPNCKSDDQIFLKDLKSALEDGKKEWRGPSWHVFEYAVKNHRPIALITARGHHPHTIIRALNELVYSQLLENSPNYIGVYPVSHPTIRKNILGDPLFKLSTSELKRRAIQTAVKDAFACFGQNEGHRFGMSDDDVENLKLIEVAMRDLKVEYPKNAFYLFDTSGAKPIRCELSKEGIVQRSEGTVSLSKDSKNKQLGLV